MIGTRRGHQAFQRIARTRGVVRSQTRGQREDLIGHVDPLLAAGKRAEESEETPGSVGVRVVERLVGAAVGAECLFEAARALQRLAKCERALAQTGARRQRLQLRERRQGRVVLASRGVNRADVR
jgi:hypothetical protein